MQHFNTGGLSRRPCSVDDLGKITGVPHEIQSGLLRVFVGRCMLPTSFFQYGPYVGIPSERNYFRWQQQLYSTCVSLVGHTAIVWQHCVAQRALCARLCAQFCTLMRATTRSRGYMDIYILLYVEVFWSVCKVLWRILRVLLSFNVLMHFRGTFTSKDVLLKQNLNQTFLLHTDKTLRMDFWWKIANLAMKNEKTGKLIHFKP